MMDRLVEAALLAIALLIVIALAGCEGTVEVASKPAATKVDWRDDVVKTQIDEHGVVCYRLLHYSNSFNCVKVTP